MATSHSSLQRRKSKVQPRQKSLSRKSRCSNLKQNKRRRRKDLLSSAMSSITNSTLRNSPRLILSNSRGKLSNTDTLCKSLGQWSVKNRSKSIRSIRRRSTMRSRKAKVDMEGFFVRVHFLTQRIRLKLRNLLQIGWTTQTARGSARMRASGLSI